MSRAEYNPLVQQLQRLEACDALLAELGEDDQLGRAVAMYLLGQLAYGIEPHRAVCDALHWVRVGRSDPPKRSAGCVHCGKPIRDHVQVDGSLSCRPEDRSW